MNKFEISLEDERVNKLFKAIREKGKNLKKPLKQAGMLMLRSIDQNFRSEGRPDKWKPLKQKTLDLRRKSGARAKILQDSGQLKQSIQNQGVTVKGNSSFVGTNKVYAGVHQFGFKKRNIPARPFLLFQDEDENNIVRVFSDYLDEVMK